MKKLIETFKKVKIENENSLTIDIGNNFFFDFDKYLIEIFFKLELKMIISL